MTRIFPPLAGTTLLLISTAMLLGLFLGDVQAVFKAKRESQIASLATRGQIKPSVSEPSEDSGTLSSEQWESTEYWTRIHRMVGILAALTVVLVCSIVVTYFIGTSRWCKEVAETYHLPAEVVESSAAVKRRAFPWSLAGMAWSVGIVALGAAADPGTGRENTGAWVTPHLVFALLGILGLAWAFFQLHERIAQQQEVIARVLAQVKEIREARGLDTEEQLVAAQQKEPLGS